MVGYYSCGLHKKKFIASVAVTTHMVYKPADDDECPPPPLDEDDDDDSESINIAGATAT